MDFLIEPTQLLDEARRGEVVIVDTRKPADYAKGHIPGAVNFSTYDIFALDTRADGLSAFARDMAMRYADAGVSSRPASRRVRGGHRDARGARRVDPAVTWDIRGSGCCTVGLRHGARRAANFPRKPSTTGPSLCASACNPRCRSALTRLRDVLVGTTSRCSTCATLTSTPAATAPRVARGGRHSGSGVDRVDTVPGGRALQGARRDSRPAAGKRRRSGIGDSCRTAIAARARPILTTR